jgi:hypothetical protein
MSKHDNGRGDRAGQRVALISWHDGDGVTEMLCHEIARLGHTPVTFCAGCEIPGRIDVVLTHGPLGYSLPVWEAAARSGGGNGPVVVHWNTEGMPDPRIPYPLTKAIGTLRSKIVRVSRISEMSGGRLASTRIASVFDRGLARYRYLGDYYYALERGLLHVLADTSQVYTDIRNSRGLPTSYIPWGLSPLNYADLNLERDIDVLWMGARWSRRRSRVLDQVIRELRPLGVRMFIADNEESPFIFREERTHYLNRAKITLNITRTWYDDNFSRLVYAAPNRSMVVSERMQPHCPEFKENEHYVSVEVKDLAKTILHYLEHEEERRQIAENAYNMVVRELQFSTCVAKMLSLAAAYQTQHDDALTTGARRHSSPRPAHSDVDAEIESTRVGV